MFVDSTRKRRFCSWSFSIKHRYSPLILFFFFLFHLLFSGRSLGSFRIIFYAQHQHDTAARCTSGWIHSERTVKSTCLVRGLHGSTTLRCSALVYKYNIQFEGLGRVLPRSAALTPATAPHHTAPQNHYPIIHQGEPVPLPVCLIIFIIRLSTEYVPYMSTFDRYRIQYRMLTKIMLPREEIFSL